MKQSDCETLDSAFDLWQRRLRWQCKRGNLETELLLANYLDSLTASISPTKQQLIEQFLAESEQDLFHWLIGDNQKPEQQNLKTTADHFSANHVVKKPIKTQYSALIADIKNSYR